MAANGTDAGAEKRLQFALLEELAALSQKKGGELDAAVESLRCVPPWCMEPSVSLGRCPSRSFDWLTPVPADQYSYTHSAALGLDMKDGESISALSYKPYALLGQIFDAGVEALQVRGVGYGQSSGRRAGAAVLKRLGPVRPPLGLNRDPTRQPTAAEDGGRGEGGDGGRPLVQRVHAENHGQGLLQGRRRRVQR